MGQCLVTGANRGIGLALTRGLLLQGHSVIATCRQSSEALEESGARIEFLDLQDPEAIAQFGASLAEETLDLVIQNAGVFLPDRLDRLDVAGLQQQWEVNTLAPLLLTAALRPCLQRGSKVVFLTSRMGSIGDNSSGGYYGYRLSKAALNMVGANLSRELAPSGVSVALLHPGYVRTDMTRGEGDVSAETAASGLLDRIEELSLASSGRFLHASGIELPW